MRKRIVLCADDYGQAPAISRGIIELLEQGRLSAVSCMVNTESWPAYAAWLQPFIGKVDVGLHFNLTEGKPLSARFQQSYGKQLFSLPILMLRAACRMLAQATIEAECQAQIEQFYQALGCLPDFFDGHQHVQQFPVIRNALLSICQSRLPKAYLRLVNPHIQAIDYIKDLKKVVIVAMGARNFERLLQNNHISYNTSFSGIYTFNENAEYSKLFPSFLREIDENGIIMCHPGLSSTGEKDPIAEARTKEHAYFASEQFLNDCKQADVELARFDQFN